MGSLLGFRPPQFSEEAAWLPTWLQQQNAESLDTVISRGQTSFEQRIKELQCPGQTIDKEENALLSSTREGYRSCHLLLSGDESSPPSFVSSTKNVVHVHLHLSSDGNSESIPSQLVDASQTQGSTSYHAVLKQAHETSVAPAGTNNQSILGKNAGLLNCSPDTRPDNETELMRHAENGKCSEVDDVNDVVEMTIAASEAVLIHEMMTRSVLKSLPVSTVIEVAFQVKKARLDVWKENFHTVDICEVDDLLDMDDLTMADAYEDVGLSIAELGLCNHDHSVSQVNHDLASEIDIYEHETTGRSLDFGKEKLKDIVDTDRQLEDNMESVVSYENRQKKLSKEPSTCFGSIMDCHNDPVVHSSVKENLQVSVSLEMDENVVDCGIGEQSLLSSMTGTSEDAEKYDMVLDIVPGGYQSRWFGGWTWKKEVKSSPQVECKNVKLIPDPFIGKTSFFSESADIAPDENSFAHNQDEGALLTSHSSFPYVVLRDKTNVETLLSQDVVRCSSLSTSASGDPLCSIVPCSISPENTTTPTLNHEGDMLTRRYSTGTTEYTTGNLLRMKTSPNKLVHEEESTTAVTQTERYQPAVYRQLTSLRTYSVLQPSPGTVLVKGSSHDKPLLLDGISKTSIMKIPVSGLSNKEICNKTLDNVAKSSILKKKENLPCILNGRSHGRFQAFSRFISDFGWEEKSLIQDTPIDLLPSKDTEKLPIDLLPSKDTEKLRSNCHCEYNARVPARKRVYFLEAENNYGPKKKLQKQQGSLKSCVSRAAKRLRSDSGAQGCKNCKKNCSKKDEKRLIFHNMDFLLTGFSHQKERELENLIRNHGGIVLSDIPLPPNSRVRSISKFNHHKLPVVLCPKKLQTIKFLYGCAVNALVLKIGWITDSIVACSLLPPEQYTIFPKMSGGCCSGIGEPMDYNGHQPIFGDVGIMLHGKSNFCIEMAKVIKHGGGQVCKTLNCLVNSLDSGKISLGAIVAENVTRASRHLKHCALERKIPMLSTYWIIKSLHRGKLLSCKENSKFSSYKGSRFSSMCGIE